jgi:hypothetical protein
MKHDKGYSRAIISPLLLLFQPGTYFLFFVRAIVIHDQMQGARARETLGLSGGEISRIPASSKL